MALVDDTVARRSVEVLLRGQSASGALVACPTFPTYGYAWLRDGAFCAHALDLADAFPALVERLARELPGARLIFNNVNDFPVWRVKRAEIRERVAETARVLDIEGLLGRRPRELSGGQRQRVAIGRALVRRPRAFLMDEPLSNLDAKLRVQMRAELLSLHRRLGITTIYVTHDQTEAMTLGDRVLVLDGGVAQQLDTPERLYRDPANTFVATFIGSPSMNLFAATAAGGRVRAGEVDLAVAGEVRDGAVLVGLRPEGFVPAAPGEGFPVRVTFAEALGPETLVYFQSESLPASRVLPGAGEDPDARSRELERTYVARFPGDAAVEPGAELAFAVRADRARLFDPDSGAALRRG